MAKVVDEKALKVIGAKLDKIAAIIETELDANMESWTERWTFPGGVYGDAPPVPGKLKRFNVERVSIAILKALETR